MGFAKSGAAEYNEINSFWLANIDLFEALSVIVNFGHVTLT